MQPNEDDMARFWYMLDAARVAIDYTHQRRSENFMAERIVRIAFERNIVIKSKIATA